MMDFMLARLISSKSRSQGLLNLSSENLEDESASERARRVRTFQKFFQASNVTKCFYGLGYPRSEMLDYFNMFKGLGGINMAGITSGISYLRSMSR